MVDQAASSERLSSQLQAIRAGAWRAWAVSSAPCRARRHQPSGRRRRAAGHSRLERRRQDDAIQRGHRRFSSIVRAHPLLRRGCDALPRPRANSPRTAPHLSDQPAVRRPDSHRQHLRRLPRRFPRPAFACCVRARPTRRWRRRERSLIPSISTTSLKSPVSTLSHGQQRQLEIALALTGAPRFILFDEPAAGLSPPSGANSSPFSTRCRRISATSSSSMISTSRCASRPM